MAGMMGGWRHSLVIPLQAPGAAGGGSTQSSLTVRNAHAMAYDQDRGVVALYGGADERSVRSDLWAWDGDGWHLLAEGGPPPRTFPCLAYATRSKRLILFGGNRVLFGTEDDTDTCLDDTWTWNGQTWSQVETETPSPRAEACMVNDSSRDRILLFGGHRVVDGERLRLGDTWEWDGARWEQVSTGGPSPRNGAAMAYDIHRQRAVLFGGGGAPGETWEWDGANWERIDSAKTEGRFNSVMAYDVRRHSLIRYGGWFKQGRVGDTWRYDERRWARLTDQGPSGRNHASMAYDEKRGVIVLFGGHDGERVFGDTWEWNGASWTQKSSCEPRRRVDNGH